MARFELLSPFPPEECAARLRAGVANPYAEIDGRVERDWLRLRKRIFGHNSFQTFLHANLRPHGSGTRISGTIGMHPLAIWFPAIVVGLIVVGGLAIVGAEVVVNGANPALLLVPPVLVLFAAGMTWFGRWLSRGQDRQLFEFLTRTLETEVVLVK